MNKKLKILAAGDLHGDFNVARKLSKKAKKNKVDLVVLAGDIYGYDEGEPGILEPFTKAKQKVLFVPGNCDFDREVEMMKESGKNIDRHYVNYNGVGIAGIGSSNWKLWLGEEDLMDIKKNFSKMKSSKKVLVSHLHAAGTKAEMLGFEGWNGDDILRHAVEKFKPDLLISAHIHEAEGIEDVIGKTRVVQVGQRGTVLEI
jgi:Icc-related predicted phosphoesterase